MKNVYIHPTALVETEEIGEGTNIWAFAHVMEGARIGKNCNIGDHCFVESGAVVGNDATVKNGNMLWEGVTIEDGVFVGPHVFFTNDLYPRTRWLPQTRLRYAEDRTWLSPTLVKQGASLGAGAILLAGITIGDYAMVGLGAVVLKDVLPYVLVRGNPARASGWVCQCGKPLRFDDESTVCATCGLTFRQEDGSVRCLDGQKS
jgi:UDP-2-acetamido-3-amino-2,3-dideoxy-glucuronate N-acetyltransferase